MFWVHDKFGNGLDPVDSQPISVIRLLCVIRHTQHFYVIGSARPSKVVVPVVSPESSDRSSSSRLSGQLGSTRSLVGQPCRINGSVGSLGLPDTFRSPGPPNTSRSFGMPNPCGSSGLPVLLGPSNSLTYLSCQAHPTYMCHQVTLVRLGHRACLTLLGRRACLIHLCCQVGLIHLECLANPTCHGYWVCRVRLGLSPKFEVEWGEFQIPHFLGYLNSF